MSAAKDSKRFERIIAFLHRNKERIEEGEKIKITIDCLGSSVIGKVEETQEIKANI